MSRYIDFDSTWARLSDTVERVLLSLPLERAVWTERFSDVYSICIGLPETLNADLYRETQKFLAYHVNKLLKEEIWHAGPDLLPVYSRCWQVYCRGAKYLDFLYHHFNNQYIKKMRHTDADIEYGYILEDEKQLLEVGELAMETWKEGLIEPIRKQLVGALLDQISNHRHGLHANDTDSQTVIHSLVTVEEYKKKHPLKYYEDIFENPFLQETKTFYSKKATELRINSTCSEYMKQILLLLTEEEMRSRKFLHQSSYKKAATACQHCVIFDHVTFLEDGCRQMIRDDARDDLLHMYLLLKSAPNGLSHMVAELEGHIKETGLGKIRSITEGNIPVQFVEAVLEVHKQFSELVNSLFHGDKHFVSALDRACVAIVNFHEPKRPCRAPDLVCKYQDAILRRCSKGATEESDEKLQKSIIVFRYIDDKDVYQKFYSRSLGRRLISGMCVMEVEEMMIHKLKEVCGHDFTTKLHSMFTDISVSAGQTKKFHQHVTGSGLSTTMNVNILQAGAWPLNSAQPEFILPEKLSKCVQKFEEFYSIEHNGRNLTWLYHQSQAEVRMQTTTRPYFIIMSTYQLAIVLLFNDSERLTYADITAVTLLKGKDLERNVAALLDANILKKVKTEGSDEFYLVVNTSMTSKRTRFKVIVPPTQREQAQEVQQTHVQTDDDRKLYLQAAIVRIMKARKSLHHNALVEEVISKSKTRFSPSIGAIKRSIEALIEKSYIERDPDTTDVYRYLA